VRTIFKAGWQLAGLRISLRSPETPSFTGWSGDGGCSGGDEPGNWQARSIQNYLDRPASPPLQALAPPQGLTLEEVIYPGLRHNF
jgi:hypothetical protein